jgi:transposase|nr:helix-turn-helix domain-containing protein [Bosea vaviloviae]
MSKALSVDLRIRVLRAVAEGASHREAADRFGVSAASVSRGRKRERERGAPRPKALGGDRRSQAMERQARAIMEIVAANRDITLAEIKAALAERQVGASIAGLWRFFRRHGITLKNVWLARPARDFFPALQSAPTYPVSRSCLGQDGAFARTDPHKAVGV